VGGITGKSERGGGKKNEINAIYSYFEDSLLYTKEEYFKIHI